MGLETLPNGMQYFSVAEELKAFLEGLYSFISPINFAIMVAITGLLIAIVLAFAFYAGAKSVRSIRG